MLKPVIRTLLGIIALGALAAVLVTVLHHQASAEKSAPVAAVQKPAPKGPLSELERAQLDAAVAHLNDFGRQARQAQEELAKASRPYEDTVTRILAKHGLTLEDLKGYDLDAAIKTGELKRVQLAKAPTAPAPAAATPKPAPQKTPEKTTAKQ